MPITTETVTHHKDAAKHSGAIVEGVAKKLGFHRQARKIGELVNRFVGRKQNERMDRRAAAGGQVGVVPAETTGGAAGTVSGGRV